MTDLERSDDTGLVQRDEMSSKSPQAQRWNELFNLAKLISTTEVVPKPLRNRPEAVFAIMAAAEERGITPFLGLQNIDIIEGRTAPSAMLQRAMIHQRGHILIWRRADNEAAVLYGRRRDDGTEYEASFTIDDAKQMKLTGKGNWATMPKAMLMARVTSLLARAHFADVVLGMEYTPEELGAVGPYAAVDLDYDPDTDRHVMVDPETGEILDDDVTDDSDQEQLRMDIVDADDAADEQWRADAHGDGL